MRLAILFGILSSLVVTSIHFLYHQNEGIGIWGLHRIEPVFLFWDFIWLLGAILLTITCNWLFNSNRTRRNNFIALLVSGTLFYPLLTFSIQLRYFERGFFFDFFDWSKFSLIWTLEFVVLLVVGWVIHKWIYEAIPPRITKKNEDLLDDSFKD